MSLKDLLPENQGKKGSSQKKNKPQKMDSRGPGRPGKFDEPQYTFSIRHDKSTKVLLDKIRKIQELTNPAAGRISLGDVVRQGLDLLANEIDLPKQEKNYAQFMKFIEEKNQ